MKAAPDPMQQLGEITRQLHDTLQRLDLMPRLQQSASRLPHARTRLDYIARQSGVAAERVLTAVEHAQHEQRALQAAARHIAQGGGSEPAQVQAFARSVEAAAVRTGQQLTDIMLAQDFHDLSGQLLAKVVALVIDLEDSLQQLRVHGAATPAKVALPGPALDAASGGAEVLRNQGEVDALLVRLGL